ncbi:hypothetical protein KCP74_11135 [Salmonella enterica subsp. enterica]|nr:hypothetical protein KCP74_11135 [Salmonella enterica subsp. enterica]
MMSGKTMLSGVLKLAPVRRKSVYHRQPQAAASDCRTGIIAVDNALAYQENLNRLKERPRRRKLRRSRSSLITSTASLARSSDAAKLMYKV